VAHLPELSSRTPGAEVRDDARAKGRLRRPFGLSELFLEASEPPFTKVAFTTFKKRFPRGTYRCRGAASDGRRLAGSDRLSFVVPAAPKLTFPTNGAQVDPDGFKVTWKPVTTPNGVKIVTYQVIVNQGNRELSTYLPPDATSATIPGQCDARRLPFVRTDRVRPSSGHTRIHEPGADRVVPARARLHWR
jgi:hypothetical protein